MTTEQLERLAENEETQHLEDLAEDMVARPTYGQYEGNYDETPEAGANGLYGLELNDGLTDLEMQFAERLAVLMRGVMIVHGQPGCGKGTYGSYIAWKGRRIFKNKKVILDYQPRILFDYGYDDNRYKYFNAELMMDEVDRMAQKADAPLPRTLEANLKAKDEEAARVLASTWAKTKGEVLMRDSIWELDELKRYLHNRHPNNRVGIQIGYIIAVWRHLDYFV
jgi:hypothetical protein